MDVPSPSTREPSKLRRRLKAMGLVTIGIVIGSVIGGVAYAAIPSTGGVINGCYSTTSNPVGQLRLIDTGQSCTASEKPISWNQKGLNFRGAWSATTSYVVGDVATYKGGSYFVTYPQKNLTPDNHPGSWAVLATPGAPGAPGIQLAVKGSISVTVAGGKCSVLTLSVSGTVAGDTGIIAPDAVTWPTGLTLMPLRVTAAGTLPLEACNHTTSSITATNINVTAYRIPG